MKAIVSFALFLGATVPAAAETIFNVTLNINYYADSTADRVAPAIRRHVALMERYGLEADYSFTWLAARMVADRDPGLFASLEAAGMGIGHHGANRPPKPTPVDRINGLSWDAAVSTLRDYESHDVDPATGALLPGVGGLKGLTELYGLTPLSTGRFVKAPILFVATESPSVRMMVGLQSNVGAPTAEAWYMGALNRPEHADLTLEPDLYDPRDGTNGQAAAGRLATALDAAGEGLRFGALLIHDSELVGGSIGDMKASGASESRTEGYWSAYETVVAFLASRRDVRVATMREIYEAAHPDLAPTLSAAEVQTLAETIRSASGLPLGLAVEGKGVSLAEALVALETTVAALGSGSAMPTSVATSSVLGPRAEAASSGSLTLSRPDLVRVASAAAGRDGSFVRSTVSVGARTVNAAEYLMALATLVASGMPSEVRVEGRSLFPEGTTSVKDTVTRLQFWSYKPARFRREALVS